MQSGRLAGGTGVLPNGLVLLNMNPFWILIVRGVILLIAIATSSLRRRAA